MKSIEQYFHAVTVYFASVREAPVAVHSNAGTTCQMSKSRLKTLLFRAVFIECRKVIGFAITTLRNWLKRFAPLFHPIRSKTKTLFPALCVSYM